jgi:tetratricopeptide (TPR) repeat protein
MPLLRATLPLALAVSLGCATDEPDWSRYQLSGEAAALSGRYGKAEALLEQALARSEGDAERAHSLRALARVARESGELETARLRLAAAREAAVAADAPEAVERELEEGWLLLAEGRPAEAAAVFERAGREARDVLEAPDPTAGWAAAGRGEALRRSGDRVGARAALGEALALHRGRTAADELKPSEPIGLLVGASYLGALDREEGRLEEARSGLRSAISRAGPELGMDHPLIAAALAELARVELARGDRDAALRAAARAAEVTEDLPERNPTRLAAREALAACAAQ